MVLSGEEKIVGGGVVGDVSRSVRRKGLVEGVVVSRVLSVAFSKCLKFVSFLEDGGEGLVCRKPPRALYPVFGGGFWRVRQRVAGCSGRRNWSYAVFAEELMRGYDC